MDPILITIMIVVLIFLFIVFQFFKFLLNKIVAPRKSKKSKSFLTGLYIAIGIGVLFIVGLLGIFVATLFGNTNGNINPIEGAIVGGLTGFASSWAIFLFFYYDIAFKYDYLGEKQKK